MLTLYGYPLSSAAYRVRIALALKGVKVTTVNKQLRRGEHRLKDFLHVNPQGFVPVLQLDDGQVLTQSLAIIEYLDEVHPEPPLLPASPADRGGGRGRRWDRGPEISSPRAAARKCRVSDRKTSG